MEDILMKGKLSPTELTICIMTILTLLAIFIPIFLLAWSGY